MDRPPLACRGEPRHRAGMRFFRTLWLLHRWIGVGTGFVLLLSAGTGLLLLLKKDFAWIQPPTAAGAPGPVTALRTLPEVYDAVFALGLPEFRTEADISRIDFRPERRIHKVISIHGHAEVQVCATTLKVHPPGIRRSDWLEQLHDGSWFGAWAHGLVMPAAASGLLFLGLSGYVMWIWPRIRRRRS